MARYKSRWAHSGFGSAAALLGVLSLGGCGVFDRNTPDEFAVTTRAPLVVPNEFSLPPPRPGVERAQEQPPRLQAQAALVPELALTSETGPDSPGQQALLKAAGRPAPANIRQRVEQEAKHDTGGGVTDSLMFWKPTPPPGTALDPRQEAARLRQRAAQSGQAAPPAPAKKSGGLFDWLF
jgi:hypothetical protein